MNSFRKYCIHEIDNITLYDGALSHHRKEKKQYKKLIKKIGRSRMKKDLKKYLTN